jgi:thiosulfate dehydrogenase [quinone] large subunit
LSEIAVGIGAVTGLAYRLAAIGGTAISFLFFLTASWTTHPYYFGNDLPYAFGWLTLALAGHGDLFVLLLPGTPRHGAHEATDRTRRGLIQVGVLALATLLLGGAAALLRSVRNEPPSTDIGSSPTPGPTISGSPDQSSSPTSTATVVPSTPNGLVVANVSDVQGAGARRFTVPVAAPAPLPAGDPAIVVELPDGTFAAFDALCTHEGCRVSYNFRAKILVCPCHGAEFDPTNHARVLGGPAPEPLLELPLVVDRRTGAIALAVE